MRYICLIILFLTVTLIASAQQFYADDVSVRFFSHAPIADVDAVSTATSVSINTSKKEVRANIPVSSFSFKRALMQKHFNEIMESNKYPVAVFRGNYTEFMNLTTNGTYKVDLKGKLSLHGTEKKLNIPCVVSVKDGNIKVHSVFKLKPEDYKIKLPVILDKPVAEEIEITVNGTLVARPKK